MPLEHLRWWERMMVMWLEKKKVLKKAVKLGKPWVMLTACH